MSAQAREGSSQPQARLRAEAEYLFFFVFAIQRLTLESFLSTFWHVGDEQN